MSTVTDRLDRIIQLLDERLGKPTETRIEVHHPTYQPSPCDWESGIPAYDDLTCECGRAMPCRHCVDVTEEPPERRVNVTITDVFAVPVEYGFLRINVGPENAVIDQNASNVTVTDVPVDTAPDVDPDEALAKALYEAMWRTPYEYDEPSKDWLKVARAAREHIEAEVRGCYIEDVETLIGRAKKAEADVERLTRERDEARDRSEALREDVEAYINRVNPTATERAMGRWLLARDDEWAGR